MIELLEKILSHLERHKMADYSKLTADVAELKTLVTELLAKQVPPPVDEQPAVDTIDGQVAGIIAMIEPPAEPTPAPEVPAA